MRAILPLVCLLSVFPACSRAPDRPVPEAISLLGDTLYPPPLPDSLRAVYQANLDEARARLEADPNDVDAAIWFGRRTAYLGLYREAIAIFTTAIGNHPDDARLYRHRGHRYITIRQFDRAIADLEHAASLVEGKPDRIEPDGLPNARNIPTSSLQSNIWYHLGLAYYLRGVFDRALDAWNRGLAVSPTNDMLVATQYWRYLALQHLGMEADASALANDTPAGLDLIENTSYYRLLQLFADRLTPETLRDAGTDADVPLTDATLGYGLGVWYALHQREDDAIAAWTRVVDGPRWAAFGHMAAEAELARRRR